MAKEVDKQVVEIEFDNSKFDKNVKKSSSTLDEFKSKLRFETASKSMDAVVKKLKLLDMVAFSVINNITTRVTNLGIQLVKSLSVNNIAAGWDKFSNKTIATATIMAQSVKVAGKELTDYAEKTEAVNEQLEKILWFTDETSYNFTDMVDSIGKFTAAGVDLDVAAKAMQGIATWAAKSGQNASTASRAMAQLAQTLGKGYVQLMDWRSIQNANMDTQEFRQTVLETAEAIGELRKQGNEYITKTGKKITSKNFTDTLSEKWFTSDVLTKTLGKYSAAVEQIYEITEKTGKTAYDVIEEFGSDLDPFGVAAFKAAQECRTLGDALNSIKDAVSTGWMTTFELLVGKYDEAKEVWSSLADGLYDTFVKSNNFRNSMLKTWRNLEGNKDLFGEHGDSNQGVFWNIYDSIIGLKSIVTDAWEAIFPSSVFTDSAEKAENLGAKFKELTSRMKVFTTNVVKAINEDTAFRGALKGVFSVVKLLIAGVQGLYVALEPVIDVVKGVIFDLFDRIGIFGTRISNNEKVLNGIASVSERIAGVLRKVMGFLDVRGNINRFLDFISSIFSGNFNGEAAANGIKSFFNSIGDAFRRLSDKISESGGFIGILNNIYEGLKSFIRKIKSLFSGKSTVTEETLVESTGVGAMRVFGAPLKGASKGVEVAAKEMSSLGKLIETLKTTLTKVLNLANSVIELMGSTFDIITMVIDNLVVIMKQISSFDIVKAFDWLKENWFNVALFAGLAAILLNIRTIWYDIIYITRGLEYAANVLTDALWEWARSKRFEALAQMFKWFGLSLVSMAAAVAIITPVIKDSTKGVVVLAQIMGVFTLCIVAITLSSRILLKAMNTLSFTWDKGPKLNGQREQGIWAAGNTIMMFGMAMLEIALAMKIIASIPTDDFDKALGVFIAVSAMVTILTGLTIVIAKVTKKGSTVKMAYPGLWSMLGFAIAMWSFGNAMIKVMSSMKELGSGTMWQTFGMMAGIFVMLGGLMIAAAKVGKKSANVYKTIRSLSLLATSMLPFVWALKSLTEAVKDDLQSTVVAGLIIYGLIGMMSILVYAYGAMYKADKKIGSTPYKTINSMALLAVSMLPFVWAVKALASAFENQNVGAVIGSLVLLTGVMAAEVAMTGLISKFAKQTSSMAKSILSLTVFNISLIAFVLAIRLMTAFANDLGTIAACVGLMIPIILSYGFLLWSLSQITTGEGTGKVIASMITTAILLGIFVGAIAGLSSINTDKLIACMVGMTAFILAFGGTMLMIGTVANKTKKGFGNVTAVLAMTAGVLLAFAGSMMMITKVPWQSILVASLGMAGAIIAVFGTLMLFSTFKITPETIMNFGLSLMVFAAGMIGFMAALNILGTMDLPSIAVGILALCGSMILLAIVARVFGAVAPTLLQMAASMVIFSTGLLLAAVALNVLAMALGPLGEQITTIGLLIQEVLTSICTWVNDNTGLILETVKNIIMLVCQAIVESGQTIMESVAALVVSFAENFDKIGDAVMKILDKVFDIIQAFLPRLFKTLEMAIDGILQLLRKETPVLVKFLAETITCILSEIRDNIVNWADMLFDIVWGVVSTFATKFLTKIGAIVNYFFDFVKTVLDELGETIARRGKEMGVTFIRFGKNLMKGLWNGMMAGLGELLKDIPVIGGALEDLFKETLQIHSPSRMTAKLGMYLMQGFGVGMEEEMNHTRKQTSDTIASCMSGALKDAYDVVNKEDDLVIRPVIDLTNVREGASSMSAMLSSINGQNVSLTSNLATGAVKSSSGRVNNSENQNNGGTVVNKAGDTYEITMNITTNDPERLADEFNTALERIRMQEAYAKGGR